MAETTPQNTSAWYIVKTAAGSCQIVTADEIDSGAAPEKWGPFESEGDAIAKRVGLIRAGKCQPV